MVGDEFARVVLSTHLTQTDFVLYLKENPMANNKNTQSGLVVRSSVRAGASPPPRKQAPGSSNG